MTMLKPRLASPVRPVSVATGSVVQLSDRTFRALTVLVRASCGIDLAPSKRLMLQTRLNRRLKATGLDSFDAYHALLTSGNAPAGEVQAFIDCVVTNETSFFREPPHFDYLNAQRLQDLAATGGRPGHLAMWSAACSTGEEVWTMAMVMDVIFCRNVLIYFDSAVQTRIVNKLCAHLRPGGLLFLGHSDMSRERQAPLRLLRNNIHERLED